MDFSFMDLIKASRKPKEIKHTSVSMRKVVAARLINAEYTGYDPGRVSEREHVQTMNAIISLSMLKKHDPESAEGKAIAAWWKICDAQWQVDCGS